MILKHEEAHAILEAFGRETFLHSTANCDSLAEEAERFTDISSFLTYLLTSEVTMEWGCTLSGPPLPDGSQLAIINKLTGLSLQIEGLKQFLKQKRGD